MIRCEPDGSPRVKEPEEADELWAESDYVCVKPLGGSLSPDVNHHARKKLLEAARDA